MQHRMVGMYRSSRSIAVVFACAVSLASVGCSDSKNTEPLVASNVAVASGSNAQAGVVGRALGSPVAVVVTDQNGAALSNAVVTWTVASGEGVVSAATTTTDADGNASVTWTLGTVAGVDSLSASLSNGATVTITAVAAPAGVASLAIVSGDGQSVLAGATTAPLIVKALDQFGNPVPNTEIDWTSASGGQLSVITEMTDTSGKAQVTLTTDAAPATYSVAASAGTTTTVSFTVNGT